MNKKITILASFLLVINSIYAQMIVNENEKLPITLTPSALYQKTHPTSNPKLYKGTTGNGWYSYLEAYTAANFRITYYSGQPIWKDSMPVVIYDDGPNNVSLHAVGQMFDPKSELYASATAPMLTRYNKYKVDSIKMFYKYLNLNPGSVDTLLVQFYNSDKLPRLFYRLASGQVVGFAESPAYDKAANKGIETSSVKILMTTADNTDSFFNSNFNTFGTPKTVAIPSSMNVGENKNMGITITFLPGVIANLGDTLRTASDKLTGNPKKVLNTFQPRLYQEQETGIDTSYNYGLFAFNSTRYSTRTNEWYGTGASINGSKKLSIDLDFYVNYFNLSTKDYNKAGYALSETYPNPSKVGATNTIEFAIGNTEKVSIGVFDILGNKVLNVFDGQLNNGKHTVSFNTSSLSQGVYFYTIETPNFKASKKLVIKN